MKRFTSLFLFSCLLLVIACQTDVELCDRDEHPHTVGVSFKYDWGGTKASIPNNMLVIANRIVNMKKTPISVNSYNGKGYFVAPNPAGTPAFTPADSLMDSFWIPKGTYKFFTFNMENDELINSSVREYVEKPEMPKEDIIIHYRTYERNDTLLKFRIPSWTDHNYYSEYIQYATSPIYFDSLSNMEIDEGKTYALRFRPHDLTQKIDIYFNIAKEFKTKNNTLQYFTVDSVFGEISGIPSAFNIATGYVELEKTNKMMFPTDKINDDEKAKSVRCHAEIHIPGILPSRLPTIYMGAGIMQVMIFCSVEDPNGKIKPDGTKERRGKKIQGKINLFNTLAATPSLDVAEDNKHAKKTKPSLKLDIKADMKVNGESIMESTDDKGGIDVWRMDSLSVNPYHI